MDKQQEEIQKLLDNERAFACYHLPKSNFIHIIFTRKQHVINNCKSEAYDKLLNITSWSKKTVNLPIEKSFKINITQLDELNLSVNLKESDVQVTPKEDFKKFVDKIKKAIAETDLQKVVASRIKQVDKPRNFNIFSTLKKMIDNYPTAFSYLFYLPENNTCWMGATPETLLSHNGNLASTMALAGTQKFSDNIVWTSKEYDEQALVKNQIAETLNSFNFSYKQSETETVKAAHLAHLCNKFSINISENTNIKTLLNALHPTPAVGGLPKQKAVDFINKNEGYNRSFYTGFLGIKGMHDKDFYFVNLRCMQIFSDTIALYVGAGITANSDAEKEWEETELKAQTMLKVVK